MGIGRFLESLRATLGGLSLVGDLVSKENLPLSSREAMACTVLGDHLFELVLVEFDDQDLGVVTHRFIVSLRHFFLVGGESHP